ncbi:hypothetical protein TAJ_44 [Mycobacterium phage Taj]|uniref:Uncharacterized protein n=5 Tax=Gracegardnervirinae TaxID=2946632 RepID=A0A385E276_9CAUD|nr:hypothetical protein PBI_WEE_45 [Mycobacterium phage Wee]YP_009016935.1 hypothetical protein CM05_gp045 [Mycobacterium phage DeadP]YP_009100156.1 hypothetical protein TAJ_44 [Mycobacterium phage Taj]YP_009124233.1 hypothetical protein PBI_ESTAVE1_42 [Mycobacterium phage Estave1]YP_009841070.1 hypothetical protein HWB85_gp045 [Mycobacterium phage Renaud18]ADU15984.1 hypothetical protein PBI_WEE_45 [Mycobacterium phage Wee]AER47789.1 hypothetical protein DEADP_45 [Mycobacterium phage DeadP]
MWQLSPQVTVENPLHATGRWQYDSAMTAGPDQDPRGVYGEYRPVDV